MLHFAIIVGFLHHISQDVVNQHLSIGVIGIGRWHLPILESMRKAKCIEWQHASSPLSFCFFASKLEAKKQKLNGEDACPSHHQCQTLAGHAGPVTGVEGSGLLRLVSCRIRVSWVSFMYRYVVVMCMLVIVAPLIVMGAWSMAFLLGQHVKYYYCSHSFFSHA